MALQLSLASRGAWPDNHQMRQHLVFAIKWIASFFQLVGYAATAFELTPLNAYCFVIGLTGWFIVGVFWKDRAIILIHVVALSVMCVGLQSG